MQSLSLNQNSASLYLLCGEEPLLLRDWLDSARESLKQAGFEDIQSLTTDTGFDWEDLLNESSAPSLFANKKCRIIRILNGKPGSKGSKVIQALCENSPDDTMFIFVVPKLDRPTKNSSLGQVPATGGGDCRVEAGLSQSTGGLDISESQAEISFDQFRISIISCRAYRGQFTRSRPGT